MECGAGESSAGKQIPPLRSGRDDYVGSNASGRDDSVGRNASGRDDCVVRVGVARWESGTNVGYNRGMPTENAIRRGKKSPPPGETGQEAAYLRFLSEKQVPVIVKLRDGESVSGWIEYFDDRMIRLTREGRPNLFIYKEQIRTITEQSRRASRPGGGPVAEQNS